MVDALPSVDTIWEWLECVPDPEIPVVSVVDIGVVRDVAREGGKTIVSITPTYSGCPATSVISFEIEKELRSRGLQDFELRRKLSPAWTSDWISQAALAKLEAYGIAPPSAAGGPSRCPRCQSQDLERISQFGSTPCKAQWRCRACLEPFDYFKCI